MYYSILSNFQKAREIASRSFRLFSIDSSVDSHFDGFHLNPGVCCSSVGITPPLKEEPPEAALPGAPQTSTHLRGPGSVEANQRGHEGPARSSGPGGPHHHGWEAGGIGRWTQGSATPGHQAQPGRTSMGREWVEERKEDVRVTSKALPPLMWSLGKPVSSQGQYCTFSFLSVPPSSLTAHSRWTGQQEEVVGAATMEANPRT